MTLSAQAAKITTKHRKSFHVNQSQLKFRPSGTSDLHGRGNRPLPEPMAVQDFIQMIVVHGCKKILLVDPRVRICVYLGLTFVLSILADAFNFPRTYFSNPRNGLNVLFTGYGWAWTFFVAGAFVTMTSLVYNCGDRRKVLLYHLSRIVVGTAMWWCWTTAFAAIEHRTGACSTTGHGSKKTCRQNGGQWRAFDISGHTFLLMYCNLLLMEEAKAILGWDSIKEAIRKEDFNRTESSSPDLTQDHETYLKDLTSQQFNNLKQHYGQLAVYVRANFLVMTILSLIYDILFLATVLYFHVMTEKLLAAVFAIFAWFVTYRVWFANAPFPVQPGSCLAFKREVTVKASLPRARGGLPRRRPTLSGDEHQQFEANSFVELRRKEMMLVETTTIVEP